MKAARKTIPRIFTVLFALAAALTMDTAERALADEARSIAFLAVQFHNDNEMYEPTSEAERTRLKKIEDIFSRELEGSGRFRFVEVGADLKARIAGGQQLGECGGCEFSYGKEVGSQLVAWINVQKVSNLILNMNVYLADVEAGRLIFVKSADMRNNTDESWTRTINYIVQDYLLPAAF